MSSLETLFSRHSLRSPYEEETRAFVRNPANYPIVAGVIAGKLAGGYMFGHGLITQNVAQAWTGAALEFLSYGTVPTIMAVRNRLAQAELPEPELQL